MNFLTQLVRRLATATALWCSLSTVTQAQVIRLGSSSAAPIAPAPTGDPAYTCLPTSSSAVQTLYFDPQNSAATDIRWRLEGDYTLVNTPSLNTNTVQFTPSGYGKLRVSVDYYTLTGTATGPSTCDGTVLTCTYPVRSRTTVVTEFFKSFPASAYVLKGPTCVPADNPSVVYSVNPALISTLAQINKGIGTDSYIWSAVYTSGPHTGESVPLSLSGDGSTAFIRGNEGGPGTGDLTGSFALTLQAGKCNEGTKTTLHVTVAPNIADALPGFASSCLPIGQTSTTFSLATLAGVNYTLSSTVGSLSPTTVAGDGRTKTITLSELTETNMGTVTVVGVGGPGTCFGTQTSIQTLRRQLLRFDFSVFHSDPHWSYITSDTGNSLGSLTVLGYLFSCLTPNSTATLTLQNAPVGGQAVIWTVSGANWSIASGQGTANVIVNTGAGPGSVSVVADGCGNGITNQTLDVTSPIPSCSVSIANAGGTTPGCAFTATAAGRCPAESNRFMAWRLYDGTTLVETKMIPQGTQLNPEVTFEYQNNIMGTARVAVDIASNNMQWLVDEDDPSYVYTWPCRVATYSTDNLTFVACSSRGRKPALSKSVGAAGTGIGQDAVRAYPSPTGAVLQVELAPRRGAPKGPTKLSLVDLLGRVQQTATTSQASATLDVSRLAEGVYTLRAELPDGRIINQSVHVKH
jgi:hypothetical protein